ncbi:MAG: protoporphyrinogen oxidase [Flavobacteriales bacterium]|nr:protoporphyrinogen oxidase [Flavobacteriales bacterium]
MEDITHVPLLILGGGISGMGAAFKAQEQGQEFLLLEAAPQLGGCLNSVEVGGHTLDNGANSCALSEDFEHFLVQLGLEDKILKATALSKKRYLFHDGKVVPVGGIKDIFGASWLSPKGKWRFATEPFRKRGTAEDESVASFLSRRIGTEATEKLVDPVLGGIYAGNIYYLSAATVLEKFKMGEQENGSMLCTLFKAPPKPRKIISLEGGFAKIGEAFTQKFTDQVLLETKVQNIEKTSSGFLVQTNRGNFDCKQLISTLPAYLLAKLMGGDLKYHLQQLTYEELSVSHFAEDLLTGNFDGFGILIPSASNMKVKGVLFTSSVFQRRAPKRKRNMTVFHKVSNMESIQNELNSILGDHSRELLHTYYWKKAIPQSHVGFGPWKKELFEKLPHGMYLAGNYLGKVGVADVFSSGYDLNL